MTYSKKINKGDIVAKIIRIIYNKYMKKLEEYTLTELKAFVYDEVNKQEVAQKNIAILNKIKIDKTNQPHTEPTGTEPVETNDNKSGTK